MKPLRISKKQIRKIDFPKSDVLADIQKKKNRKQALQSAANHKKDDESAVKIVFESKRRGPLSIQSDVLVRTKIMSCSVADMFYPCRRFAKYHYKINLNHSQVKYTKNGIKNITKSGIRKTH